MIDFQKLAAPFPPSAVSWRVGSVSGERGMALAYLDARDVADRLDAICGPSGWQCRYSHVGSITVCEIGIWVSDDVDRTKSYAMNIPHIAEGWNWKADGAGQSDIEAEKGALSDAFKRAAVRWGIGRYLYHLPSPWVEIEKRGKTSMIAKHEYARLQTLLSRENAQHPSGESPGLPPADQDVVDGATRWVKQQIALLNGYSKDSDIFEWDHRNERALHKLKLQHRDLWDEVAEARLQALEGLRAPV